jgi:acyl-CoA synthetase (NDP forming)
LLPAEASVGNPVDMVAGASAQDFACAARLLAADESVGSLLVIFVPTLVTAAGDVAGALKQEMAGLARPIPVVTSFQTAAVPPPSLRSGSLRIPAYDYPEDAVRALARAADYASWRAQVREDPPDVHDARGDEAAAIVANALGAGGGWLSATDVAALLDCYGIPRVAGRIAHGAEDVVRAARELGGPIALKAIAKGLLHKSDAGGVRLGLRSAAALRRAVRELRVKVSDSGFELDGVLVQRMAEPGVEMLVGVVQDPSFGPVIACGAGGTVVELLHDVAVRITPLTSRDAHDMIRSLRTFPLLDGYRGAEPLDATALEDVLLRISALVEAHPAIAELDCNPVIVTATGATVVDARVRVEQPPSGRLRSPA